MRQCTNRGRGGSGPRSEGNHMVAEPTGHPVCSGLHAEDVDPLTTRVFQAMGRVMRLHRQALQKAMDDRGIHHSEAICLRIVAKNEGVSQRQLADMLHISQPQVTKVLQSLERNGFIVRRVDENDQRRTLAFLTPAGRDEEGRYRGSLDDYLNRSIGGLPEADRRELERLFNEIADRIETMMRGGGGAE
jgi:MarR family transcriptional regulator, organic hydroperoxide resistance regulator